MQARASLAVAILITAAGLAYVLAPASSTRDAMSYDSFRYLAGAESILENGTYRDLEGAPQRIWPPGVSLLYAGFGAITGAELVSLVPVVNGVAYLLTAAFLWLLARVTRMKTWTTAVMLAAILLNTAVLAAHRKVWSEPPTLALLAAMLLCVAAAKKERLLFVATAIAAVAILFRFAMLATVPFLCVAFFFLSKRRALTLVPLLAPLPWFAITRVLEAPVGTARTSSLHLVPWRENVPGLRALADQLIPARALGIGAILLTIALVVFAVIVAKNRLSILGAGWALCFAAFVLFAQAIATPSFALDLRILLPLYVGLVIAIAAGADASRKLAFAVVLALPLILVPIRGARQYVKFLGSRYRVASARHHHVPHGRGRDVAHDVLELPADRLRQLALRGVPAPPEPDVMHPQRAS